MSNEEQIPIGLYLFKRLHELGVRGVHGVPGDFNLATLDLLPEAGLEWVGNCNELNAGYAADGYARIKGISALITTFGVGELSALAAVAGAYSEHVPIVHIVGVPNTGAQKNGLMLHHTLGNGDFGVFQNIYKEVSLSSIHIRDPGTAAAEIDKILAKCYIHSRPVYIALPTDMAYEKISSKPLHNKLDLSLPANEEDYENEVVEQIKDLVYKSERTVILADACTLRHGVVKEVRELVDKTKLPAFATPMGKGAIDENLPNYGGVYVGDASRADIRKQIEEATLILYVGGMESDFNTAGFTFHISPKNTIEFHSDHMKIRYSQFPKVSMKHVLPKLLKTLDVSKITKPDKTPDVHNEVPEEEAKANTTEITHDWLWPNIGQWLRPKDIVITETGTANFGIIDTKFPEGVTAISQVLWGSIGYSVGACQGAALAAKEDFPDRRVILFVGDGSLQLTVQEISTMYRRGLKPIIFVINNSGYAIERTIHGMHAEYNDIQPWDLEHLFPLFSGAKDKTGHYRAKTRDEFLKLLQNKEFSDAGKIQIAEIYMPKLDVPRALKTTAEATAKMNAKMRKAG